MSDFEMSSDLQGLPIESLIGAPLEGAAKANLMLAEVMAEYIDKVGYTEADGKGEREVRTLDFKFNRPLVDAETGKDASEEMHVEIPLISMAPIPNLLVKTIEFDFDFEVKSMTTEQETDDGKNNNKDGSPGDVRILGVTTSHREQARNTDKGAKYQIKVVAETQGVPETLSRVIDMMATSIVPVSKKTK